MESHKMRWFDILKIRATVKREKGDKMWCDAVLILSDDVTYLDIVGDEDEEVRKRISETYMKAIEHYLPKILKRARKNAKDYGLGYEGKKENEEES